MMSLQVLNISVDSPDLYPDCIPEDLNLNDMESIVEIVLEQVLGIEDAIPEQDDDDTTCSLLAKAGFKLSYEKQLFECDFLLNYSNRGQKHKYISYNTVYAEQFHPEIVPPPPRA